MVSGGPGQGISVTVVNRPQHPSVQNALAGLAGMSAGGGGEPQTLPGYYVGLGPDGGFGGMGMPPLAAGGPEANGMSASWQQPLFGDAIAPRIPPAAHGMPAPGMADNIQGFPVHILRGMMQPLMQSISPTPTFS